MRYLLLAILILGGILINGTDLDAARFDWSLGEPKIADDSANTTYYCWSLGEPIVCYQYQAAAPPPSGAKSEIWWE
jgi:hypothetical protein